MTTRRLFAFAAMVAASGCSAATEPGTAVENGFREIAEVHVDSALTRTLIARITLENSTTTDRQITWREDCAFNGPLDVLMYKGDVLVWESARVDVPACAIDPIASTVSAGQSASFEWRGTIASILGDSLAPGDYTFRVRPALVSPQLVNEIRAGGLLVSDPVAVPPGTNLDGTWTGSTSSMSVSLALTWTADSVYGSGTYHFTTGTASSGAVTFAGHRTNDVVTGGLIFDFGYVPPYFGRLRSATEFDGTIPNIDTPGTPLVLKRGG